MRCSTLISATLALALAMATLAAPVYIGSSIARRYVEDDDAPLSRRTALGNDLHRRHRADADARFDDVDHTFVRRVIGLTPHPAHAAAFRQAEVSHHYWSTQAEHEQREVQRHSANAQRAMQESSEHARNGRHDHADAKMNEAMDHYGKHGEASNRLQTATTNTATALNSMKAHSNEYATMRTGRGSGSGGY